MERRRPARTDSPRRSSPPRLRPRRASRVAARTEYHHGDLRAALLDSVGQIIREQGLAFVSIREVARRAHVSHAAPAHHFRNKSGLLTSFAAQGFDRLADTIAETIRESRVSAPPDVLAAMGRGYVRFAVANPEHFSMMFRLELLDGDDREYRRASNRAYDPLIATVRAAAGQASLAGTDPVVISASAWSLVHGLAALWLSGRIQERTGATDVHALAEAVTDLFVTRVFGRQ